MISPILCHPLDLWSNVTENRKGSSMLLMKKKWKALCEEQWDFTYIGFPVTSLMIFWTFALMTQSSENGSTNAYYQ